MFQTNVEIPKSELKLSHTDQMLTLGSCFAENIGRKMQRVYFDVEVNPFGVLYNPVSILQSIDLMLDKKVFAEEDLFKYRELWNSFSHSSLFSATTPEQCLSNMNASLSSATAVLKPGSVLLITFGTAWVFEEKKSGRVVSNCHKLPAAEFTRRRLTVNEIVTDYSALITRLSDKYPDLKLIFSVSPIRHWKDGAHENNLSKSTLLLAIDALQRQFGNVHYFPAYEIQMDELRDYRFYASDMLHPSEVAVDYIWQRFGETYFDRATQSLNNELEQLVGDLSHRPLHPESDEFRKFQLNIEKRKAGIVANYPFLSSRIK